MPRTRGRSPKKKTKASPKVSTTWLFSIRSSLTDWMRKFE